MRFVRKGRARAAVVAALLVVAAVACQTASTPAPTWNGGLPAEVSLPAPVVPLSTAPTGDGGEWVLAERDGAGLSLGRLDADGRWSSTFGTGGWEDAPNGFGSAEPGPTTKAEVLTGPGGTVYLVVIHLPANLDDGSSYQITHVLADGSIDANFGSGGSILVVNPGDTFVVWNQIAAVSGADGRIIVEAGGGFERYTTAGQPDPTFSPSGGGGTLLASAGGSPVVASGGTVSLMADQRGASWSTPVPGASSIDQATVAGSTIVVLASAAAASGSVVVARLSTAGVLDPTFHGNGVTTVASPYPAAVAVAGGPLLVDSAGRVDLPFLTQAVGATSARIVRLTAAGAPDPLFGQSGQIVLDGSSAAQPAELALPDESTIPLTAPLAVLQPLGTGLGVLTVDLDGLGPDPVAAPVGITAFGINGQPNAAVGTATVPPLLEEEVISQIAPMPDGGAVVVADAGVPDGSYNLTTARLVRLTAAGTVDPTFGIGGVSAAVLSGADPAPTVEPNTTLQLMADGSFILGAAPSPLEGGRGPRVVRFTSAGQIDSTFGTGGIASLAAPAPIAGVGFATVATIVRARPGGYVSLVVESGQVGSGVMAESGLLQLLGATGQPVGAAVSLTDPTTSGDAAGFDLAVDAVGRILVAVPDPSGAADAVVMRYTPSLDVDSTFGTGGTDVLPFAGIVGLQVSSDGRILVASPSDGIAARLPDGGPDTGFGTNGVAAVVNVVAFTVDGSGRPIAVVGPSKTQPAPTVHRFTTSGQPDSTLGGAGGATVAATQATSILSVAPVPGGPILLGGSLPGGTATVNETIGVVAAVTAP